MNKKAQDYHSNMTRQFHLASSNPKKNIERHEENLKKSEKDGEDEKEVKDDELDAE